MSSSSDGNLEIIPLTLTLSPPKDRKRSEPFLRGKRGQIAVHMNPSFHPERRISGVDLNQPARASVRFAFMTL